MSTQTLPDAVDLGGETPAVPAAGYAGGLTYGIVAPYLAGHGFCADDVRLLALVNKATQSLLSEIIPVGGMAAYNVVAIDTFLYLPKELENAIVVEVLDPGQFGIPGTVNGQSDVKQGWYNLVNQFTYVDPNAAHDNPLIDHFLVADPLNPTTLRRLYEYPGLNPFATVRVTGAKRWFPILGADDYLLIQNIRALELEIQSIQKSNYNEPDLAATYHKQAVDLLTAEVKKHQLDPTHTLKRKSEYEADLVSFQIGTYGYMRAQLAFEIPGALLHGKSELSRLLDMAEQRLMNKGLWVGCLEEYRATVVSGRIYAPATVKSIIAADLCGQTLDVRNIFFQYQQNGPGRDDCGQMLIDEGEEFFPNSTQFRRRYRLVGAGGDGTEITFVAKLRWVKKAPTDRMTIRNPEAIRLMVQAIIHQQAEKWPEAAAAEKAALKELDSELTEYLAGQKLTVPIDSDDTWGFGSLGDPL